MPKFAVAGTGKLALDVAQLVQSTDGAELVCTMGDPGKQCETASLSELDCEHAPIRRGWEEAGRLLTKCAPDFLLSVNNFRIIPKTILDIPAHATLNFHNGALPRYAGLNPCSWAILRGEKEYGVTWHLVEPNIDSGDIIEQVVFPLNGDETALELVMQCIEVGFDLFKNKVMAKLMMSAVIGQSQNLSDREYFSGSDQPYDGHVPWWLPYEDLERYARALSFAPLPNMFFRPRILLDNGTALECEHLILESKSHDHALGDVVSVTSESLIVAVESGLLECDEVMVCGGSDLSRFEGQEAALKLVRPENGA